MYAVKLGERYLRTTRLATTVITALTLMAGLSACSEASREGPLQNPQLEYHGKVDVQVITLDNGKKVNCAVAAANGVSMTCDWAGAH
jgi:hypothetical protein